MKKLAALLSGIVVTVCTARADTAVVFNEIMYHPAVNEPTNEWVEFHNQLAVDVDISEWSITGGIQYTFPSNTIVRGRGYLLLALSPTELSATLGMTNIFGPFIGRLSNNGDTLRLRNNSGRVVDEVDYGVEGDWPVAPDGSGVSLAKRDVDTASADAANWTASEQLGGTPGANNFPFTGVAFPDVLRVPIDQSWRYDVSGAALHGTGWEQPAYNDSAWPTGAALFYNGPVTASEVRPIPTLFSTGIGTNGSVLSPGVPDPHYTLTVSAQGGAPKAATVILNHPAWMGNDAASSWIGPVNPGEMNIAPGPYFYLTRFDLTGFVPGTARIEINLAADDRCTNVFLNGVAKGISFVGFAGLSPTFTLTNGFVAGTNTLEFRALNDSAAQNPGGFRALVSGTGQVLLTNTPVPAGPTTYYFRTRFNFSGGPANALLKLRPIVDDGAVYYLNGIEVYRQNMPEGPITAGTFATTNVGTADFSAPISISSASLVQGENVLAVEVHQSSTGGSDVLFGTELLSMQTTPGGLRLVFNELSASTNGNFWFELFNPGTNSISLENYSVIRDGLTNEVWYFEAEDSIAAGGYQVVTNIFQPVAGDKLLLLPPARDHVLDAIVVKNGARARFPDGADTLLRPTTPSPGAANIVALRNEIVINEIMYNPHLVRSANPLLPPQETPEAWIELFNRSASSVDLTGWELSGGIDYRFPAGKMIPAGDYLVVADDAAYLRSLYPAVDIIGNFGGRLSGKSDRIVLRDATGNPADEVTYFDGGRWPGYADGGGSSLELRDPNADNSKAEAWAASDETGKSSWEFFSYRMVANIPADSRQPTQWRDFILGLHDSGECLIDDLSVIEAPGTGPAIIVANGDFENGLTGWRTLGTHNRSRVEPEPGNPANKVLHLIATGPQEHMHNHIEATLITGRTIQNGREYQVSFRARWLAGNNLLNTRLYFNRAARTTALSIPPLNGTPGAQNSGYVANIGPTFTDFGHQRVVPSAGEQVTVSVIAQDPHGVASAQVFWSVNSGIWNNTAMAAGADGQYSGTIPGQSAGAVVQFYVQATDGLGAVATYPARGQNSGALYKVEDGQANLPLAHNVRLILTPANINLMHGVSQGSPNQTNVMSNDLLPCTVIYDERRAYYDCGVHLRGSQRGRYSDIRTGFHIEFPPDDLFRGVHPVMLIDRSGAGDATANRQEEIVLKHILNRAGGIPGTYSEICRILAPRTAHTGSAQFFPRHEDVFLETAFDNGGDGTMFEMELIYYPTSANAAGYKNPQPDEVMGTDITNLGDDKEIYRYNFMIKNHRDADDYSRFVALGKAWALSGAALDAQTRQIMDIDQWMRAYALVSLCSVGDMYTFGNNHNFFMYQRPDGKFLYFPWDMDFAFTGGATRGLVGDQNLGRIVNLPSNLRRLYAHMLDIINISFNSGYMAYWTDHYDNLAPGQNYAGSLTTIGARATFVRNTINSGGGNAPFNIANTNITSVSNLVLLTGTAPIAAQTIEINGNEYPITWTTTSAWRMLVPVSEASNALEVVARDLHGNVLSNFTRTVMINYTGATPPDPRGVIVFNEIMYNPAAPDAAYIELFNTSSNFTFDISGWQINGLDYTFPPGSYITNRQFLVVASSMSGYATAYGTATPVPFDQFPGNLQNDGETITLLKPAANTNEADVIIDRVRYEGEPPWPSLANGTGSALQLIDASQENARAGNWFANYTPPVFSEPVAIPSRTNDGWRFVSLTTNAATVGRLLLYLGEVGSALVDDISLVAGPNAGVGFNYVRNGDFESPLLEDPAVTNSWLVNTNYTNSVIVGDLVHSGNGALKMVCSQFGNTLTRVIYQNLSPAPSNAMLHTMSFWFWSTNSATNLNVRVQSSQLTVLTNIQVTITPSNYIPSQIIVAATNTLSPGRTNQQTTSLPPFPDLWINEAQPENLTGIQDNAGQRDPWIEIYNAGANVVELDGLYLSDTYTNLTRWAFPPGSTINPHEFKVIFCDAQPVQSTASELHTSFRLAAASGSVALSRLYNGGPQVLDYLNYAGVHAGRSFGSFPDGQPFERFEFIYVTAGNTNDGRSLPISVFINEWMAQNTTALADPADDDFDDWFELYNAGASAVDLTGYRLTDVLADRTKYLITTNGPHVIPAGGYLLVWADNETGQNTMLGVPRIDRHVNFQLAAAGESIGLFAPDGTQIDAVTFTNQTNNVSMGRYPDGSSTIVFMPGTETPRAANRIADGGGTAPSLRSARLSGDSFEFQFDSTAGRTYSVEFKNDLSAPVWMPLGDFIAGGTTLSITNSITNSPQRFFRVRIME